MTSAALRPTITQQVRAFLEGQGVELRPWSGLDETYAELYELLRLRRDDPKLWLPLTQLLEAIKEGALSPSETTQLPAPDAELLASWDIEELVHDLRKTLPDEDNASSDKRSIIRFAAQLQGAALGGFLLLGMAASGCSSQQGMTSHEAEIAMPTGPTPIVAMAETVEAATPPEAVEAVEAVTPVEIAAPEPRAAPAFCPEISSSQVLHQSLEESNLSDWRKQRLCQCLASVNESWVGGLTELFESSSPEEIARTLNVLAECCVTAPVTLGRDYASAERGVRRGNLCQREVVREMMVPLYRGVSFRSLSPLIEDSSPNRST